MLGLQIITNYQRRNLRIDRSRVYGEVGIGIVRHIGDSLITLGSSSANYVTYSYVRTLKA